MLILAKGRCENCGEQFGPLDMLQSVNLVCDDCGRQHTLCRTCKAEGCHSCSGTLLDTWELAERDLPGGGVIF